jgi:hypothetical protein
MDAGVSDFAGTYKVVISGALTGEQSLAAVKESLAREFGLTDSAVDSLLDGQRRSVKRGMGWETAEALLTRLQRAGAAADVELELSPSVWREAFVTDPPSWLSPQRPSFSFRIAGLIPLVCLLPGRRSVVEGSDGSHWVNLRSQRFAMGVASRWLTAFVVALLAEMMLVRSVADAVPWGIRVGAGFVSFAGLLYVIAALLQQPRRFRGLMPMRGKARPFQLVESRSLPGLTRRFAVHADGETWELRYRQRPRRLDVFASDGALMATASVDDNAAGAAQDLTSELRDEAMPFAWLPELLGIPIPGLSANQAWSVFDDQSRLCARFARGYRCRWFTRGDADALPEPLSVSMALVLAGV